jgi:hypothetical protein
VAAADFRQWRTKAQEQPSKLTVTSVAPDETLNHSSIGGFGLIGQLGGWIYHETITSVLPARRKTRQATAGPPETTERRDLVKNTSGSS